MPLKQSSKKSVMGENIKQEMHAGKPQKQAIAIAYSVMRRNRKKKMADGGQVGPQDAKHIDTHLDSPSSVPKDSPLRLNTKLMAKGGYPEQGVNPEDHPDEMSRYKLAEGGMVQNEKLNPRHEPGQGPQTSIQRDSIQDPSDDDFMTMHDESIEDRPTSSSHEMEDDPHGMLGMDAKSIVDSIRSGRSDMYPRPGDKYRDSYADDKYAMGGEVKHYPAEDYMEPKDLEDFRYADGGEVDPMQQAQQSMRDAFHYPKKAEGGMVTSDPNEDNVGEYEVNSQAVDDDQLSQDINRPMREDLSRSSNELMADDPDDNPLKKRLHYIMAELHAKHYRGK